MAPETINFDLIFQKAVHAIRRLCDKASLEENSKMILTEADLQSWIFCYLQRFLADDLEVDGATDNGRFGVHCETSFLNENEKLQIKPDVIIIAKEDYSVDPKLNDSLYRRKGYSAWGSSIPIELKILRTYNTPGNEYRKWQYDIDKLNRIKSLHYGNPTDSEKCFPLFVLFCRVELSDDLRNKLQRYARCKNVSLIISIFGHAPSCYQS
jgi:hypothetical protein